MQKKDCFLFGTIFKLHGYKGEVNIYNDDEIVYNFSKLNYFLIELENELVPFFIEKVRLKKTNIVLVKFEDVDSKEKAKRIHNRKVYLPKDLLPKSDENEITEKKLVGFSVIDINLGNLGKINFINSQTPQQLIYVNKDGKEFCFPMHKQFVKEVNPKKRIMKVKIPKEFLSLN